MSKKQKSNYSELLQDPRWQKKRVDILQRDNFTCQHCGSTEKSLQVHHLRYQKWKKPWEYDNSELLTLCHRCHEAETQANQGLYEDFKWLKEMWKELGFSNQMLVSLLGCLSSYLEDILAEGVNGKMKNAWQKDAIIAALFGTQHLNDFAKAKHLGYDSTSEINQYLPHLSEAWNKIKDKKHGNDI